MSKNRNHNDSTPERHSINLRDLEQRILNKNSRGDYSKIKKFKDNTYLFLNLPATNILIALLILLSVYLVYAELTTPSGKQLLNIMELNHIITIIFTGELVLRYFSAPNKRIFFSNYWIDILAVLPIFRVFRSFRIFRLLRLLRLFRAGMIIVEQSGWLSKHSHRYFRSATGIIFATFTLILCGALSLLAFEGGGSQESFIRSFWLSTFLFISGEFVGSLPQTEYGRATAALVSLSGLVVFAILIGTISASMTAFLKTKMESKHLTINELKNHLIICGWDNIGRKIISELEAVPEIWNRGVVVVARTENSIESELQIKNSRKFFQIRDDFTKFQILEQAGAKLASTAIVLSDRGKNLNNQDIDARTVLAALTLEKLNPQIYTCAELIDELNATHLKVAGVEEIVSRTDVTAGLFALSAINRGMNFIVSDIFTHYEGSYLKKIPVPQEFIGKEFLAIFNFLKKDYNAIAVGIDTIDPKGEIQQHVNPPSDHILSNEDQLTLILHKNSPLCKLSSS